MTADGRTTSWLAGSRLRRSVAAFGGRPDSRMSALSLALAVLALGGYAAVLAANWDAPLRFGTPPLIALALLAMFAGAEGFTVHVQVRRGSHAISLVEIPMIFGLLVVGPALLVPLRLLGGTIGLIGPRHQRGMKLHFNIALLGIQSVVAVLVFRVVLGRPGGDALGVRGWLAAYAAMLAVDVVAAVLVTAAIALHDDPGEWRRLPAALSGVPLVAVATSIALLSALAIDRDARAAIMLVLVYLVVYAGYRAYVRQTQGHAQVEGLYGFTTALDTVPDSERLAAAVLAEARDQLRAETAALWVPQLSDQPAYLVQLAANGEPIVTVRGPAADDWWVPAIEAPIRLAPPAPDRRRRGTAAGRPWNGRTMPPAPPGPERRRGARVTGRPWDGMAVPLPLGDDRRGVLMVTGSLPDVLTFDDEQLRLFQALANHAGVSLARSRLVDQLRAEVRYKEYLSLHDTLTGLPNRYHFAQLTEAALATASGGTAPAALTAVALLDLDRFKEINDALGHDIGDALLREVAGRLQEHLGRTGATVDGTVARLGGDEFAILLPGLADAAAAEAAGIALASALNLPVSVGSLDLAVRGSIGMAVGPADGEDAGTLLQRADVAMYAAKASRAGVRRYQPSDDRHTRQRLTLIGDLGGAIHGGGLEVFYQPKVAPGSGEVVGAEALARWIHPVHGHIPPDEFIPLAEHSGLIQALTLHVLEVALRQCAGWRAGGRPLHIAVNLSPNSLLDPDLVDDVERLLGLTGVPAHALTLEVTEGSILLDPEHSTATLHQLHALGVQLSIDDFGTGYSSLGRLRALPLDEMKVDKSFVQGLAVDRRDRAVVRSAVQLGHALDLAVVAEGVEDLRTMELLAAEGCDIIQGYLFSRPLPAAAFAGWLAANNPTAVGAGAPNRTAAPDPALATVPDPA